jgi:Cu(I)/Ag(I) efflux system membrane fusion protein
MNVKATAIAAGGRAVGAAVLALVFLTPLQSVIAESPKPHWEAVQADVSTGKSVRLEVRLAGVKAPPAASDITVTSKRLDMGPDGMESMTAPLKQVAATTPGVVAFETDIPMAGRWALTITAKVDGQPEPVSGTVVFTVSEKRTDATPAAPAAGERRIVYYRNPMGLPDTSPVPKKDSMGMDYIPVYEDEVSGPAGAIRLTPEKIQRAGVRTALVSRQPLVRTVRGAGTVTADERRLAVLNAKFDGFVEKLFVSLTGVEVHKGDPLVRVWIDSQEILQKQADFLAALKSGGRDVERAAANLRLFGIPDEVIAGLRRTGTPVRSIVLTAATAGTVMEKPAVVGMRFEQGSILFRIADLSTVWVMARVAERDLPALRIGQQASITLNADSSRKIEGRIALIYPELDMSTRTAMVHIEVPNPEGKLKVGQYADVAIEAALTEGPVVAIPDSAVLDSGTRQVAFVAKDGGVFEPRDVVLGLRGGGLVEVREGLSEGERIVVSGNFLIDAESNLRAALATFTAPQAAQ